MKTAREIIERYSNEVWRDKRLDSIDKFFHQDAIIHSPLMTAQGPQGMKEIVQAWLHAFPDNQSEHEALITEGDFVVLQWTARATHRGEFQGIAATGKPVRYSGVTIYRVEQGKIAEYWGYVNLHELMESIRDST